MIINRTNLDTLFKAYNGAFRQGLIGQQANSMYAQVAMETTSSTAAEVYPWLGKVPGMKEWLGERVVENLTQHTFEIRNKDFEDTIAVHRNSIEDDQYGVYAPMFQALGEAVMAHYDELVWPLLKNGAKTLCYDGQNFFDTDHPVRGVGTAKNFYGATGGNGDPANAIKWYLMDLRRTFKPIVLQIRKRADNIVRKDRPDDENVFTRKEFIYGVDCRDNVGFGLWQMAAACTADLTAANLQPVYSAMEGLKGDEGRPLGLKPTHVFVAPSQRAAAYKLLKSELIIDGGEAVTNVYRDWAEIVVVPWLA